MTQKAMHMVLAAALFILATAPIAHAQATGPLTGAEVVALGPDGDGETITLVGEAIGDSLRAEQGHQWINVLSGGVAVGVWLPDDDADLVGTLGDYRAVGDIVRATGRFNYACDQHGGDLDVHAETFTVTEPGRPRPRPVNPREIALAAFVAMGAAIQWFVYRRNRSKIA